MSEEDFVLSFSLLPPPAPNPTYSTRRLSTVPNSTPPSVPHTAIQGLQAPCSLRSTHFLDLDDDVFGLIHASLDPDRQAALRSTCRALHSPNSSKFLAQRAFAFFYWHMHVRQNPWKLKE
eukprot:scaffold2789_cov15-Tisochrysis_lutea.AAC.1